MKKLLHGYLTFGFLVCSQVYAGAQNTEHDEQMIKEARLASNEAIRKHDYEGVARHFTSDVTVITASGKVVTGRDSMITLLKTRFKQARGLYYKRNSDQVTIAASDTIAWENGRWTTHGAQDAPYGKYSATWCKRQGVWLIRSELFVPLNN
jgi:ketosteroid isomerase-like protein